MKARKILLTLISGLFFCSLTYSAEIIFPASQVASGHGMVAVYQDYSTQKMNLRTEGVDNVTIGGISYNSAVNNTLECDAKSQGTSIRFIINPWDNLSYWLKMGIGSYEIEVPSSTVKNKYGTIDRGMTVGFGIRSRLFPDTIVSPAMALDFGIEYGNFNMQTLQAGSGALQKVSDKFELTELQAAFLISKRIKAFEPYGGIKVFRTYAAFTDADSLDRIYGTTDSAGVFAGLKTNFYPNESLVLEASFFGRSSISVGLDVGF
jgi:hypothetical protein